MVQCFAGNLELIYNNYGQYDVSSSTLTEIESEKFFFQWSHNGTVAMNPEAFMSVFGKAAAYLIGH